MRDASPHVVSSRRAEEDRLDEAEAALDDGVDPDDPRVEEIAVQRYTHHMAYDADPAEEEDTQMSASEAVTKMPYDFSPARMRCMERVAQLVGQDARTDS
ncbi:MULTISPECIES: hypothetical protein [Streptomyces violaceusniger group]|uniref:hypothetical protein n=1 Tax=Streptomyces violaceusniger group TaxID=2839105 RepID=UPI001BAAE484|nr:MULTISPECIES: hypothetical protein [Streptomyces violaceusniger group]